MNAANIITLVRFFLVPVFIVFYMLAGAWAPWVALAVFALAAISDKADGYVAKKYNQVTELGKIMDPLADKLLVFAAMALFTAQGLMHPIALLLIIARELTVTSFRVVVAAAPGGRVVGASFSGKLKTVIQLAAIMVILALPLLPGLGIDFLEPHRVLISQILSWAMAAITVISGIDYFCNGLSLKNIEK